MNGIKKTGRQKLDPKAMARSDAIFRNNPDMPCPDCHHISAAHALFGEGKCLVPDCNCGEGTDSEGYPIRA